MDETSLFIWIIAIGLFLGFWGEYNNQTTNYHETVVVKTVK